MKKLFLLGDSVLKGVIYQGDLGMHSYTLCPPETAAPLCRRGFEITNRSRMGATLPFLRDNWDRMLSGCPDAPFDLLFGYGGNDSDHDWKAVSAAPGASHAPNTAPEDFCALYRDAVARARAAGARVALANLIPIDPKKYFAHISRGLDADAILSWLGDESMLYRWHEYYNSLVEKTAADCGCPVIDIRGAFLRAHNYPDLISPDGIHPSEEGHRLLRAVIAENIG